jgi:hypothetical protein
MSSDNLLTNKTACKINEILQSLYSTNIHIHVPTKKKQKNITSPLKVKMYVSMPWWYTRGSRGSAPLILNFGASGVKLSTWRPEHLARYPIKRTGPGVLQKRLFSPTRPGFKPPDCPVRRVVAIQTLRHYTHSITVFWERVLCNLTGRFLREYYTFKVHSGLSPKDRQLSGRTT